MELNNYIESTLIKIDAKVEEINKLCEDAIKYHFDSICVSPYYVKYVKEILKNTGISVSTVVGFNTGNSTISTKEFEAIDSIQNGADEIDLFLNMSAIKNKDYEYVKQEIENIRDAIDGKILKVIIRTNLLTPKEIAKITTICNETFINYIGIYIESNDSLDLNDIDIINENKNDLLEIKVSCEIKNMEQFEELINKDVMKIGTSNAVNLMYDTNDCKDC